MPRDLGSESAHSNAGANFPRYPAGSTRWLRELDSRGRKPWVPRQVGRPGAAEKSVSSSRISQPRPSPRQKRSASPAICRSSLTTESSGCSRFRRAQTPIGTSRLAAFANAALDPRSDLKRLSKFVRSLHEQVLTAEVYADDDPASARRQFEAIEQACSRVLEPVGWSRLRWISDDRRLDPLPRTARHFPRSSSWRPERRSLRG